MKISVFGAGYVGLVTATCLANLGHNVLCCDIDKTKIQNLQSNEVPFYEPGLKELIHKNKGSRLNFSTNTEEAVQFGDVLISCVGTPPQENGSANLNYVMRVAENVAKHANKPKTLVNRSTVPPGTARKLAELIQSRNPAHAITIVSNPEFLKEGSAVHDFNHPDRIIIGAENKEAYKTMREVYSGILRAYTPIVETNWENAELIKYANNCFLATKISFINEIANICDKTKADIKIISQALGLDYRISPKFLNAGIGYGGSCFPKDVKALINYAKEQGYNASMLKAVDELNERQKTIILDKLKKHIPELKNKIIAILGLSFKPKTSDTREAPSLRIISELLKEEAKIQAYDPANEEAKEIFGNKITITESPYQAAREADAILILTEWDEFRNLDLKHLKENMTGNILCDGRNIYNPTKIREAGFKYEGIGRA